MKDDRKAITKVNPVTGKTETHWIKKSAIGNPYYKAKNPSGTKCFTGNYPLTGFYSD